MIWRIITHLRARLHEAMADRELYNVEAAFSRFADHEQKAAELRAALEASNG